MTASAVCRTCCGRNSKTGSRALEHATNFPNRYLTSETRIVNHQHVADSRGPKHDASRMVSNCAHIPSSQYSTHALVKSIRLRHLRTGQRPSLLRYQPSGECRLLSTQNEGRDQVRVSRLSDIAGAANASANFVAALKIAVTHQPDTQQSRSSRYDKPIDPSLHTGESIEGPFVGDTPWADAVNQQRRKRSAGGAKTHPETSYAPIVNVSGKKPKLASNSAICSDAIRKIRQVRKKPKPKSLVKLEEESHAQWGYIRHQTTIQNLSQVKTAFNRWKRWLHRLLQAKGEISLDQRLRSILDLNDVPSMRKAWETLTIEERNTEWPGLMMSTLQAWPSKACIVLSATMDPLPPGYAIQDVLAFIVQTLRIEHLSNTRERTVKAEEMLDLFVKIIEDTPRGYVPLRQRTIGVLARKLPGDQASELFAFLQRHGVRLHYNTSLQFARALASDMKHKDASFEILKLLIDDGVNVHTPAFCSIVTALLHCKLSHDDTAREKPSFSAKAALEYFMEKGFNPNTISFTAFLDSLCQQAQVEEATRLALLFSESGIQLDEKAWSTVFRGAKTSLEVGNVVRALDVAKAANAPYMQVLNNTLHAIFYFSGMLFRDSKQDAESTAALFSRILRLYSRHFELEPLQWWLPDTTLRNVDTEMATDGNDPVTDVGHEKLEELIRAIESFFSAKQTIRFRPDSSTIATMLRSYIRSLQEPTELVSYYEFFKSRFADIAQRGSFAKDLVHSKGSLVHDTFIMAMTQHRGLSRQAMQIFGDMLEDYLGIRGRNEGHKPRSTQPDSNTVAMHPKPTVFTFNILVNGLLKHSDMKLAEKMMRVMREHEIVPNRVTWNTLIRGYAAVQDIPRTVSALQDMEAAGLTPDSFTFKAFGRLTNQKSALNMMEGIIDKNRKQIATDDLYKYSLLAA